MSELISMRASAASKALQDGSLSSVELTQAHLDRMDATEGALGAFLARPANALEAAASIDQRRAAVRACHPWLGCPSPSKMCCARQTW